MSKIPLESRPLRLAPQVEKMLDALLLSLAGPELLAAQDAILAVYRSGLQMPLEGWVEAYRTAVEAALDALHTQQEEQEPRSRVRKVV